MKRASTHPSRFFRFRRYPGRQRTPPLRLLDAIVVEVVRLDQVLLGDERRYVGNNGKSCHVRFLPWFMGFARTPFLAGGNARLLNCDNVLIGPTWKLLSRARKQAVSSPRLPQPLAPRLNNFQVDTQARSQPGDRPLLEVVGLDQDFPLLRTYLH